MKLNHLSFALLTGLACVNLVASLAEAKPEGAEGHGGRIEICTSSQGSGKTIRVLDYAKIEERNWKLHVDLSEGKTWQEKAHAAIAKLERIEPGRAKIYHDRINRFEARSRKLDQYALNKIKDYFPVAHKLGCDDQVIINQAPAQAHFDLDQDTRFWVDWTTFNALEEEIKAGLVLHETFYEDTIAAGAKGPEGAMYLNAILASKEFANQTQKTWSNQLREAGIPTVMFVRNTILKTEGLEFYQDGGFKSGKVAESTALVVNALQTTVLLNKGSIFSVFPTQALQDFTAVSPLKVKTLNGDIESRSVNLSEKGKPQILFAEKDFELTVGPNHQTLRLQIFNDIFLNEQGAVRWSLTPVKLSSDFVTSIQGKKISVPAGATVSFDENENLTWASSLAKNLSLKNESGETVHFLKNEPLALINGFAPAGTIVLDHQSTNAKFVRIIEAKEAGLSFEECTLASETPWFCQKIGTKSFYTDEEITQTLRKFSASAERSLWHEIGVAGVLLGVPTALLLASGGAPDTVAAVAFSGGVATGAGTAVQGGMSEHGSHHLPLAIKRMKKKNHVFIFGRKRQFMATEGLNATAPTHFAETLKQNLPQ